MPSKCFCQNLGCQLVLLLKDRGLCKIAEACSKIGNRVTKPLRINPGYDEDQEAPSSHVPVGTNVLLEATRSQDKSHHGLKPLKQKLNKPLLLRLHCSRVYHSDGNLSTLTLETLLHG